MTQHCRTEGPCAKHVCYCGFYESEVAKALNIVTQEDNSLTLKPGGNQSVSTMTSNEAFVKATEIIDKAVADLVEASKEPALRFAHDLTTIAPLFDVMTESQAHIVGEYLDAEISASNAKVQEAVKNAFA